MAQSVHEVRELRLVSNVELKIALTTSEPALQSVLKLYLAPLLLKLASPSNTVRDKVISICQHINTRIKPPSVQLPVAELLKQFKSHHNALIRHFDILYIQQGLDRLDASDRANLLHTLIGGIAADYDQSSKQAAAEFGLFLRIVHSMRLPVRSSPEAINFAAKVSLDPDSVDTKFTAVWLGRLLLYSKIRNNDERCPGLSKEDCHFLEQYGQADTWDPSSARGLNLIETKVLGAKLLATGIFAPESQFLPALIASADVNSRLSDIGDDIVKRTKASISLEDPAVISSLFGLYLGEKSPGGKLPVKTALQTKILGLLQKSRIAAGYGSENEEIVRNALASSTRQGNTTSDGTSTKGLEQSKLRAQVFGYTNWIAKIGSTIQKSSFAPTTIAHLRHYIDSQGWPRPIEDKELDRNELASRSYAYESIGLLASSCPEKVLLEEELELLRWLFQSLTQDASAIEVSLSIEHALAAIMPGLARAMNAKLEDALANLLLYHVRLGSQAVGLENVPIARSPLFLSLRFANRCLPFESVEARLIDFEALRGSGSLKNEVVEEAIKGLEPYWHALSLPSSMEADHTRGSAKLKFANFSKLVRTDILDMSQWDLKNNHEKGHFIFVLKFCRNTLLHECLTAIGKSPIVDQDWSRNIEAIVTTDQNIRLDLYHYFQDHLQTDQDLAKAITQYLKTCFTAFTNSIDEQSATCGQIFLDLSRLLPRSVAEHFVVRSPVLRQCILSTNADCREISGQIFGFVSSCDEEPDPTLQSVLSIFAHHLDTWRNAKGKEILEVHGSLLAIGYYLSRHHRRWPEKQHDGTLGTLLLRTCQAILGEAKDTSLLKAAYITLSQAFLYSIINEDQVYVDSKQLIRQKLIEAAKIGDRSAVIALGHIGSQARESDTDENGLSAIFDGLYELHDVRLPELQLVVGESLSCIAYGWRSSALQNQLDILGPLPPSATRHITSTKVLDRLLKDCKTTKPALRQAVVIWLLCMVQYCGEEPEVIARFPECQAAFKTFLADRETLNQESASRGLTLLYEKGDEKLKRALVQDLVGSFTGKTSTLSGNVSADTELFNAGTLPTGSGSITTYKDIMSLASEVGDSSLVYRFMSLASHDALWSSRAALGRFGLSNILSDASQDGTLPENPKLFAVLYRYRFDPMSGVRIAMNRIWNSLVKDSSKTLSAHFVTILEDLLTNILDKEWRTRQASCAALAELIQGQPIELYEHSLNEMWALTFKVCDDIKESVRSAATSLARSLTGILIRALEAGDSSYKTANKMLSQVLPFLLGTQGLESGAPDVQSFSRKTVLDVIKKSSAKTLRPFLPQIVGKLLALLSSIEPEMINYLHMNADTFGVTKQELDDARLKHVRGSSMLEAIERCLDYLDEDTMPDFLQSFEDAIKTVIGLPSRVGCSRILVSLCMRRNFIFKPYADRFLRLTLKQVLDRNDTISSAFAGACGYIVRIASDTAVKVLTAKCKDLYFESDDDKSRLIAGDIMLAMSKHATDRFNAFASDVLPLVFVAKHDQDEGVRKLFETTWTENVGGSRTVLLYLNEITALITGCLTSQRWSIKHAGALAIADIAGSAVSTITDNDARVIWPALRQAVSGKTWDGKEKVLVALVHFAKTSRLCNTDAELGKEIQDVMLRESKRNNIAYRQYALEQLGIYVRHIGSSSDLFSTISDMANTVMDEFDDSNADSMDVDHGRDQSSNSIRDSSMTFACIALLNAMHVQDTKVAAKVVEERLAVTYNIWTKAMRVVAGNKVLKEQCLNALARLFARLQALEEASLVSLTLGILLRDSYAATLLVLSDDVELVRAGAAETLLTLTLLLRYQEATMRNVLRGQLDSVAEREPVEQITITLRKAAEALAA